MDPYGTIGPANIGTHRNAGKLSSKIQIETHAGPVKYTGLFIAAAARNN
jgi:hypothetical protein